jgi:ribonuclease-3
MNHVFGQSRKNEPFWQDRLNRLQEGIGYFFRDPSVLYEALTHSSFRNETGSGIDNERLEFIGDAVLQLLATEWLVARFPNAREGELTKRRSALVCEDSLLDLESRLGLFQFLRTGKGIVRQPERGVLSIRADSFEALLGAIHTDGGLGEARKFLFPMLEKLEKASCGQGLPDPKSALQEKCQRAGHTLPEYVLVEKQGNDDEPLFTVAVRVEGRILGVGTGHSKKEAEFMAAREALEPGE